MQKNDCYQLGSIVKKHGYKGEVKIRMDVDFPSFYADLDHFLIEMPEGLMPFFLEYIQLQRDGFAIVKLEGYEHEDDIAHLLRKEIYLPLRFLPPLEGNQFYFHEIVGFNAIDESYGNIGTIQEVMESGAQELLRIDFKGKEILVPINDQTLGDLDRKNKTFHLKCPEGLIALYLGEDED